MQKGHRDGIGLDRRPARELRRLRVGPIKRGVVLVVWTERHADVIRVISARFASRVERALFHEYMRSIP